MTPAHAHPPRSRQSEGEGPVEFHSHVSQVRAHKNVGGGRRGEEVVPQLVLEHEWVRAEMGRASSAKGLWRPEQMHQELSGPALGGTFREKTGEMGTSEQRGPGASALCLPLPVSISPGVCWEDSEPEDLSQNCWFSL